LKKKSLENLGVQEMKSVELKQVTGGGWWPFVVGYILIEVALNPMEHLEAIKRGFKAGEEAASKY
jgi:hypothetical protein